VYIIYLTSWRRNCKTDTVNWDFKSVIGTTTWGALVTFKITSLNSMLLLVDNPFCFEKLGSFMLVTEENRIFLML